MEVIAMTINWELIGFILQICGLVLIPFTIWLVKTVMTHNNKLALLEQKVNDSVSSRLTMLEKKMDTVDVKIELINTNIVKNNTILDNLCAQMNHLIQRVERE